MSGRAAWAALLLAVLALSGCSSEGETVTTRLTLEQHSPSSPPPSFHVEIFPSDFDTYPILEKLLGRWERENRNGTLVGFSAAYPYGDGLALIRELQGREPAGYWRAGTVVISYKETFFDLVVGIPHPEGAA